MKIENNSVNHILNQVLQPARVEPYEANKMNYLMNEYSSEKNTSSVKKSTDSVSQSEYKVTAIKEWYKTLKINGKFSLAALSSSLKGTFTSACTRKEALWYALSQEKSAKDTDKASPELLATLEQNLLGSFYGHLLAAPPKARKELKALLSKHFPLEIQKESALWYSWVELKEGIHAQEPLLDMVRKELNSVIQINAMVKNMLAYSHKLDLS